MKKILILTLILFSTSLFAFPTSWWVNGNGYTGLLTYKVNPNNNKVTGKLLGTPVEGYLVGRHLVLHRYPNGKTQIWEGWIKDSRLKGNIPSYNNDYFLAGTISVKNNGLYPWFGIALGKTAGVPNTNTIENSIITNGSFEKGPKNVNDYLTLYAGSTELLGWKIERGSIDLIEKYWKSSHGKRSIDLCGTTCSTISQVVKTIPGRVYQLSFDLSGNGYVNEIKTIKVRIGNIEKVFKFNTYGKNTSRMGWQKHSFNYKAISNMTRVVFEAPDNLNSSIAGPALDNVQLKLIR